MGNARLVGPLVAFAVWGTIAAARAEAPPDIPMTAPRVLADMERTHVRFKIAPKDNPSLAFAVAVPNDWTQSPKAEPIAGGVLPTERLGAIAAPGLVGSIAVTLTSVAYEIPLDAWVRDSFTRERWTVVAGQWFPGPNGLFYELTGTRVVKGAQEVRRTSVRQDGGRIFSVNCFAARKHWDTVKEVFWVAHVTFELLHPSKEERAEAWRRTSAKGPNFEAAYPDSWSAEPVASKEEGISAVDIRLLDAKGQNLLAYLQIKAQRGREPLSQLDETARDKLRKAGFVPVGTSRPLSEKEDPRAMSVAGWMGGFSGLARRGATPMVTTRSGFVKQAGVTFSFSLISPTMRDDPLVALRAQRAFEIARATVRLVKQ